MTESGLPMCAFHMFTIGVLSSQFRNNRTNITMREWLLSKKCLVNKSIEDLTNIIKVLNYVNYLSFINRKNKFCLCANNQCLPYTGMKRKGKYNKPDVAVQLQQTYL